ncbi:unnamed protein product [Clonostachys rosea]|uniref:2EXR domain-containing protein n=1 Tax=Bionectria ochroleuca TaxID=29856 RepID=A0ABY6UEC7_BIOOC|nr:unnamed protein product [Clonostachys rosea]
MTSFHLFPQLPPEIRSQIWHYAVPDLKPGVHLFKTGCWTPTELTPSDEDYLPPPYSNGYAEFDYSRIKKTWLSIPLLHANHEARGIALFWAGQYDLQLSFQQDLQELGFLRRDDHKHDALYITPDTCESFATELLAPDDPRFLNRTFSISSFIDKIIMPQSLLEQYMQDLGLIFKTHDLEALYVDSLKWTQLLKEAAQVLTKEFGEDNRRRRFSLVPVNLYGT